MQTGLPLARPMFVEFENVSDTLITQYMWGEEILVSPVLEAEKETNKTFLPEGVWYSLNTSEKYEGGKWIENTLQSDKIPVFVKGGSIIPMAEGMNNTESYSSEKLTLNYYDAEGQHESVMYFDDGKTRKAYEKGEYQLVKTSTNSSKESIEVNVSIEGNSYEAAPKSRSISFNILGTSASSILINGNEVEFESHEGIVAFTFELSGDTKIILNH